MPEWIKQAMDTISAACEEEDSDWFYQRFVFKPDAQGEGDGDKELIVVQDEPAEAPQGTEEDDAQERCDAMLRQLGYIQ